jgi:hypothetical protein
MEVSTTYFKRLLITAYEKFMKKFIVREVETSAKLCIMNSCFTRSSVYGKDDLKEKHINLHAQMNNYKKIKQQRDPLYKLANTQRTIESSTVTWYQKSLNVIREKLAKLSYL